MCPITKGNHCTHFYDRYHCHYCGEELEIYEDDYDKLEYYDLKVDRKEEMKQSGEQYFMCVERYEPHN